MRRPEVRRSRRLVVSSISTLGNYDYGFYWYFYLDGTIQHEIKLTGMVAASAVVGLVGKEGSVIRKTVVVFVYYALLPGALGYSIVWSATSGVLNVGTVIAVLVFAAAAGLVLTNGRLSRTRETE